MSTSATGLNLNVPDYVKHPRLVGMLQAAHDTRLSAGDTTGTTLPGTVVVNGSIRSADVNFNVSPVDDELLIVQFSELTPNPDGISIITPQHGDEAVDMADEGFESS